MKKKILGVLIVLSVFFVFTTVQASSLKLGSRSNDVATLQQLLINKGYLKTKAPTGYFGSMTRAAVIAFQQAMGLTADGAAGPKTMALINGTSSANISSRLINPALLNPTPIPLPPATVDLSNFSSQYLTPNYPPDPWPPVVQHNATAYSCSTIVRDVFGTPTTLTGTQKNINGRTICLYSFSDGGAGSFSGVYTYVAAELNGSGTERVDFRSSWHSCGVYGTTGDPQYDQCKNDQATFFNNVDAYIASLMSQSSNTTGCTSTSAPSITVTSPNGGETYTVGQPMTVTWSTCNPNINDNQIMIVLKSSTNSSSGNPMGKEIGAFPNTGTATFTVPATSGYNDPLTSGNHYKISAQIGGDAMGHMAPSDSSDNSFTINAPSTVDCTSPFIFPAGGETLQTGNSYTISWKPGCVPSNAAPVDIVLMTEKAGPDMVASIAGPTIPASQSTYTWNIPANLNLASGGGSGDGYFIEIDGKAFGIKSNDFSMNIASPSTGTISVTEQPNTCVVSNTPILGGPSTMTCTIPYSITANGTAIYVPELASATGGTSTPSMQFIARSSTNSSITYGPTLNGNVSVTQTGSVASSISSSNGNEWVVPAGATASFVGTFVLTDVNSSNPGLYKAFLNAVPWGTTSSLGMPHDTYNLGADNPNVPGYVYIQ